MIVGLGGSLLGGSLSRGLVVGLADGLVVGLVVGLGVWLNLWLIDMEPVEQFESKSVGLIIGLIVGLVVSLGSNLGSGLPGGLVGGVIVGLDVGLSLWLKPKGISQTTHPNQDIWRSIRNMLLVGLFLGLGFGLLSGLSLGLDIGQVGEMGFGLFWGLGFGLLGGLFIGLHGEPGLSRDGNLNPEVVVLWGKVIIQHFALRMLSWRYNLAPLNYARFLDHCHDRIFLRKVGGGYIFIHRMLLEHFAQLTEDDIQRLSAEQ